MSGKAAVPYGVPKATFNLDILIEATPENTQHLLDALLDAGLGTASLANVDEILSNEITIFKDRVRIDVQISTLGLSFQDAWGRRAILEYQGQSFFVVSREDLISSLNYPAHRAGYLKKLEEEDCIPHTPAPHSSPSTGRGILREELIKKMTYNSAATANSAKSRRP